MMIFIQSHDMVFDQIMIPFCQFWEKVSLKIKNYTCFLLVWPRLLIWLTEMLSGRSSRNFTFLLKCSSALFHFIRGLKAAVAISDNTKPSLVKTLFALFLSFFFFFFFFFYLMLLHAFSDVVASVEFQYHNSASFLITDNSKLKPSSIQSSFGNSYLQMNFLFLHHIKEAEELFSHFCHASKAFGFTISIYPPPQKKNRSHSSTKTQSQANKKCKIAITSSQVSKYMNSFSYLDS